MTPKRVIGRDVVRFDVLDSTNEKAKEMLDKGTPEGLVIVAGRQAAGRGRHGRAWASPPGGLYISIVLRPAERNVPLLSLLSGLPVLWALSDLDVEADLKWPNDVLVGGKKISGILCEGVFRNDEYFVVVGVGVNAAVDIRRLPQELYDSATSLKVLKGGDIDVEHLLRTLLEHYGRFYERYRHGEMEGLIAEYRQNCSMMGKRVIIQTAKARIAGKAVDITNAGALIIETTKGRELLFEGTVLSEGAAAQGP